MPGYARVAIVTGANKGIGYAIVRNLALEYPSSSLNNGPLLIYLGSRSGTRGKEALEALLSDKSLQDSSAPSISAAGGPVDIKLAEIDIASSSSIAHFRSDIQKTHPDGVDILINNAAIAMKGFNSDVVEQTFATNYFGTLDMLHAFLPLMKNAATSRVVNVSSMSGHLTKYSESTAARFRSAKTVDDVTALLNEYKEHVKAGKERDAGFISAAYATSKAGLTGVTRTLAREQKEKGSSVLMNACCPGEVQTDMSGNRPGLTPDQGAQLPVKLALQDIGGVTGEYWKDDNIREW